MKHCMFFVMGCFLTSVTRAQKPGTLDSSFGEDGKLIIPTSSYTSKDVLVQKDGKIIHAGSGAADGIGTTGFLMVRYYPDGAIDSSFGMNGWAVVNLGNLDVINAIAEQPDKKLVAAGTIPGDDRIALVRYNPNGTLDSTFGKNGIVLEEAISGQEYLEDMTLLPDGKIAVTGYTRANINDVDRSFTARFLNNGIRDQNFGVDGYVITKFDKPTEIHAITVQADGKILIGGSYDNIGGPGDFVVIRYLVNGTIDAAFGINGLAMGKFTEAGTANAEIRSMLVQPDGKIVTAGKAGSGLDLNMALARFETTGDLDEGFGQNGRAFTTFSTDEAASAEANDLLRQPDGKLVVVGNNSDNFTFTNFALARFKKDGTLDSSFGENGMQTTGFTGASGSADAADLQEDGKIVLGGDITYSATGNRHLVLCRYDGDKSRQWYVRIKRWLQRHGFVWEGIPESNVRYYAVQRSSNGSSFTEIARIFNRKGSTQKYQYEDASSLSNDSYYRIVAFSNDGSTISSNVLQIPANASAIKVFPNPAKNTVTVQGLPENKKTKLVITDINGNTLLSTVANNNYQWNISQLKQGHYVLKAEINNQLVSQKFIKE